MCLLVLCKNSAVKKASNEDHCVSRFHIYHPKSTNCGHVGILCASCFSKKNAMLKGSYHNHN